MPQDIVIHIDMYHEYKNAGEVYKNHKDEIKKVIEDTYKLIHIGDTEGLLALEEIAHYDEYAEDKDNEYIEYKFLKKLIMMVVDGYSHENIQFIIGNYVVNETDDFKRIVRAIYKNSLIYYSLGWRSTLYTLQRMICNIFPDEYQDEVSEYTENVINTIYENTKAKRAEEAPKHFEKVNMSKDEMLTQYKNGELVDKLEELSKRIVQGHTDLDVQRYLRELDFGDVILILVYGNKELNDKILNNCSSRLKTSLMRRAIGKYNSFGYSRYKREWIETLDVVVDKTNRIFDSIMNDIDF